MQDVVYHFHYIQPFGFKDGRIDGFKCGIYTVEGKYEGRLGAKDGERDRLVAVGTTVERYDGGSDGLYLGVAVGNTVGRYDGGSDGLYLGVAEGNSVGSYNGAILGENEGNNMGP